MKSRIICVAIIAVFIIFACVFSLVYTEHAAENIIKITERIYREENTAADVEELNGEWEKYSEIAAFYISHNEIEDVTALISGLGESYNGLKTLFKMNCVEIMLTIEHINESQKPRFNNIF